MNSERIKEIQQKTSYPNSVSVEQALLQVWNECEQPKQETLEEVANKNNGYLLYAKDTKAPIFNEGFIAGYQLAQQQNKNLYSEEEVLHILTKFSKFGDVINQEKYLNQWFKQFKKQ